MPNESLLNSEDVVVAEWPKSGTSVVRIGLSSYRGTPLLQLREWYEDSDGAMKPGKGIALNRRHLLRLQGAVTKALELHQAAGGVCDDPDEID